MGKTGNFLRLWLLALAVYIVMLWGTAVVVGWIISMATGSSQPATSVLIAAFVLAPSPYVFLLEKWGS